jgi:hypothetical protein
MRAFTLMTTLGLIGAITVACSSSSSGSGSGGGGGAFDCSWLQSDNCWKTTAAAAESCLPASTETGTLSADNKSCTFASGATVTFDSPLTLPTPQMPLWNFTVTKGGQTCLAFHESDGMHMSLKTSAGTTTYSADSSTVAVSCPNGSSYSTPALDALMLLGCDAGAFGGFPGESDSSSSTSVSFALINTGATDAGLGSLQVFNCAK